LSGRAQRCLQSGIPGTVHNRAGRCKLRISFIVRALHRHGVRREKRWRFKHIQQALERPKPGGWPRSRTRDTVRVEIYRAKQMPLYIEASERTALLSMAVAATQAAGSVVTPESQRYAACAVTLMKAAIGDPLTLDEAQTLLERCSLVGTPLEQRFCETVDAIKARRARESGADRLDS
jgi:hypothetical protein